RQPVILVPRTGTGPTTTRPPVPSLLDRGGLQTIQRSRPHSGTWSFRSGRPDLGELAPRLAGVAEAPPPGQRRQRPPRNMRRRRRRITVKIATSKPTRPGHGSRKLTSSTSYTISQLASAASNVASAAKPPRGRWLPYR